MECADERVDREFEVTLCLWLSVPRKNRFDEDEDENEASRTNETGSKDTQGGEREEMG